MRADARGQQLERAGVDHRGLAALEHVLERVLDAAALRRVVGRDPGPEHPGLHPPDADDDLRVRGDDERPRRRRGSGPCRRRRAPRRSSSARRRRGSAREPATTPTTPRVYLCASGAGTGHRAATSASAQPRDGGRPTPRERRARGRRPRRGPRAARPAAAGARAWRRRSVTVRSAASTGAGQRAVVDPDARGHVDRDDERPHPSAERAPRPATAARAAQTRPVGADAEQPVEHHVRAGRERRGLVGAHAAAGGPQRRQPARVHALVDVSDRVHRDAAARQVARRRTARRRRCCPSPTSTTHARSPRTRPRRSRSSGGHVPCSANAARSMSGLAGGEQRLLGGPDLRRRPRLQHAPILSRPWRILARATPDDASARAPPSRAGNVRPCASDSSSPRAGGRTSPASSPATTGQVMNGLATHADEGDACESIWVYDHFHAVPEPQRRGRARGVEPDQRVRGLDEPRPPRPDVHVHGVPQPRLPGEGRGDGRRHLRRPRRDGHRRRLVRARVARVRLRLPVGRRADRDARRGRADLQAAVDQRHRDARRRALPGRRRAARRPLPLQVDGPPLWIAGGGEKKTLRIAAEHAAVHELRRHARGLRAQVGGAARALRRPSAAPSTRSPARPTTTWSSARPRPTSTTASPGSRSTTRNTVPGQGRPGVAEDFRNGPARRHARADRREAAAPARRSA